MAFYLLVVWTAFATRMFVRTRAAVERDNGGYAFVMPTFSFKKRSRVQ